MWRSPPQKKKKLICSIRIYEGCIGPRAPFLSLPYQERWRLWWHHSGIWLKQEEGCFFALLTCYFISWSGFWSWECKVDLFHIQPPHELPPLKWYSWSTQSRWGREIGGERCLANAQSLSIFLSGYSLLCAGWTTCMDPANARPFHSLHWPTLFSSPYSRSWNCICICICICICTSDSQPPLTNMPESTR